VCNLFIWVIIKIHVLFHVHFWLIVILRHIIAYFSINIRWHSQNVSTDSRKWLTKHLFPPTSCKKQINKQNSYLLLAFLQSGSVPELDMHESKHLFAGSVCTQWLCEYITSKWRSAWPQPRISLSFSLNCSHWMERNVLKERLINKDDKNRHFVL
jgi:hypothetical protein